MIKSIVDKLGMVCDMINAIAPITQALYCRVWLCAKHVMHKFIVRSVLHTMPLLSPMLFTISILNSKNYFKLL